MSAKPKTLFDFCKKIPKNNVNSSAKADTFSKNTKEKKDEEVKDEPKV